MTRSKCIMLIIDSVRFIKHISKTNIRSAFLILCTCISLFTLGCSSKITLAVDVLPDDNAGTIQIDPVSPNYEEGTEVTIKAIPKEGWHFIKWRDNSQQPPLDIPGTNTLNIIISVATSFSAVFEKIPVISIPNPTPLTTSSNDYTVLEKEDANGLTEETSWFGTICFIIMLILSFFIGAYITSIIRGNNAFSGNKQSEINIDYLITAIITAIIIFLWMYYFV